VLLFARGYFRRACSNVRQVLGPSADGARVRRVTQAAFANYARYIVDVVRLAHIDPQSVCRNVVFDGWEHVEEAFGYGQGVIVVGGHIGSWDLAGAVLVARGKQVSALTDTLSPPRWNDRVQRTRDRIGMQSIPIESGLRAMLAPLRRNEALAILVDRPVQANGVAVQFFGRTTSVPAGAATLAIRTGAAILPAVMVRAPSGSGFIAHIGTVIRVQRHAQSSDEEARVLMQRVMTWLENVIRRYPDQWYMFRQMWPAT
jgi:KDO2-lipid IV(A) lauroyltransferase